MRFVTIEAPYCLRKDNDNVAGTSTSGDTRDGFYIVDQGILVSYIDEKMIRIYERDSFQSNGYNSTPALQINLQTVASMRFMKFVSKRLSHAGGMMVVTGVLDRGKEEIVTIKMENRDNYKLLVESLKAMGI